MSDDDSFTPRLGRMRARGGRRGRRYLHQVLRVAALAGGRAGARGSDFQGSRARGAGVGRVLAVRDHYAAFRARRVVVKARIVKLAGLGLKAARLHLRYIQRGGVTREGLPGDLYDADSGRADGKAFLERADGDRHQFRFIVSAEDGAEYEELRTFTRRLMRQMEQDLDTRLDWVAVDHFNTGHPHSHIVLRGKDDQGQDLVIARDYLATGMRERAAEIVSLDLGPRTDLEIEQRLRQEVDAERFTSLDRRLLRDVEADGMVVASSPRSDRTAQTLRAGRLQQLRRLGLADEAAPGRWQLAADLEPTLRRMGERGDIIKTLHREMLAAGRERSSADYAIYDPTDPNAGRLVGRVVSRGLSDEAADRHYLIVDGVDGRAHYVDIGGAQAVDALPLDGIVAIGPRPVAPRPADRTVAGIAAANAGRYSAELHARHDPSASPDYIDSHVRRLEALRRGSGAVERQPDGTWSIAPDHLELVARYEQRAARSRPVAVEVLSDLSLGRLAAADGATWLDRELLADAPASVRDAGFGREVRTALAQRRQWLIGQSLAREEHDRVVYRANLLGLLRRRELTRVAGQLSGELGLGYVETKTGSRVEGVYRRRLDLASGRFALIETSREFTLVPWRAVLERDLGKGVSGAARSGTISWSLGRKRSGPGIS